MDNISLILIAKNEEKNLPELINSIKNQKLNKNKFEVILVDWKSKDNTIKLCKKAKFRIIKQKKLGVSNARNIGWKNAKNNIIFFIEADSFLDKNCLKEIYNTFKDKNVKCARPNIKIISKNWLQKGLSTQIKIGTKTTKGNLFPIIYRKFILEELKGYDEKLDFAEDRELPNRVMKANYKSKYLNKAKLFSKPVSKINELYKQGIWYGSNIFNYFKKTKDFKTMLGLLVYASLIPLLILSIFNIIFLIFFITSFLIVFIYSLKAFFLTKNLYSFIIIPISFIRGYGEFIGLLKYILLRNKLKKGKVN